MPDFLSKAARDNRANQLNPAHPAYHLSRGAVSGNACELAAHSESTLDNRAEQLNPNNAEYKSPAKARSADVSARSPSKRPR